MTDTELSTWDELRRVAQQLELEIHLAGMEARERWNQLQPRLAELERTIERSGKHAGEVIGEQLASVARLLHELREEVDKAAHRSEQRPS